MKQQADDQTGKGQDLEDKVGVCAGLGGQRPLGCSWGAPAGRFFPALATWSLPQSRPRVTALT